MNKPWAVINLDSINEVTVRIRGAEHKAAPVSRTLESLIRKAVDNPMSFANGTEAMEAQQIAVAALLPSLPIEILHDMTTTEMLAILSSVGSHRARIAMALRDDGCSVVPDVIDFDVLQDPNMAITWGGISHPVQRLTLTMMKEITAREKAIDGADIEEKASLRADLVRFMFPSMTAELLADANDDILAVMSTLVITTLSKQLTEFLRKNALSPMRATESLTPSGLLYPGSAAGTAGHPTMH